MQKKKLSNEKNLNININMTYENFLEQVNLAEQLTSFNMTYENFLEHC